MVPLNQDDKVMLLCPEICFFFRFRFSVLFLFILLFTNKLLHVICGTFYLFVALEDILRV